MATEEPPRRKVDFFLINQTPRPISDVVFKTLLLYKNVHTIVQHPIAIYCFPSLQPHLAQPEGFTQFEIKFTLPELIAKIIKENPSSTKLQFRFGEQLQGMSDLSEGLPEKVLITINSHETTTKISPVDYNCIDYLYLENVDIHNKKENVIKICWPTCKNPFYMVVNIVEPITVEYLVKQVHFHNKVGGMTLNTKAKAMEILKNFAEEIGAKFASTKFSLLCPITKLRIKLPARSLKCNHLSCFDLHTFFSLNVTKPTWKCPICSKPILINELVVDSFFLNIINSPSFPENCTEVVVYANGNWEPHIEPKTEILEDDETETVNNQTEKKNPHTYKIVIDDYIDVCDENKGSKANDGKPDDFKPMTINQSTDNSDIEEKPSTKITKTDANEENK